MLQQRVCASWYRFFTLKHRIIFIVVSSSIMMFFCVSPVSYFAITSILNNKINAGAESNLRQIQLNLQSSLADLNHVTQQMGSQGVVGTILDQFLSTSEPFERSRLVSEMKTDMNIINFTNPGVGLVTYYFSHDHTFMLENSGIKAGFDPATLPLIASYYQITYYGPHVSMDQFNNQYVLSAVRKVDLAGRADVYVYVETGFKLTQNLLDTDQSGIAAYHLMLDNDGRVAYSQVPDVFPLNSVFGGGGNNQNQLGLLNNYYWFKATSNQGWSVVSVIPREEYNKERDQWMLRMLILLIVFLLINLLLALRLWDFVYRPLDKFNREIQLIEGGNFHTEPALTRIPEFDALLGQFQRMKRRILELITEVQRTEKSRADLEIEKLLYQINPHFLMNTLNTAHWLAVMNDQPEIDRIVQTLNKLLSYNLNKTGRTSTIRDEIDALQQYMVLQQIRHEFDFEICVHANVGVMEQPVPRFILQPIVENMIYHGLSTNGRITVTVQQTDRTEIAISDNGVGMTAEKIQELLTRNYVEQEKVGMGIGMNYVKRMLESHYNGQAELQIESTVGHGTTVRLYLPVQSAVLPAPALARDW